MSISRRPFLVTGAFRTKHSLELDPQTERFMDSDMNKYLAREHRQGFEVPRLA